MRETKVELPDLKNSKGKLKLELKYMTYSYCYMCNFKFDCNAETKREAHCMNYSVANDLKKVIDYYYENFKELKEERKNEK